MMEEQRNIVLNIENLSVGYKSKKEDSIIAQNIHFDVSGGDLTAIIGVNGIGKSTLLRTLGNMQPKLSGEIKIKGRPLKNYKPLELASEISVVLTEPIASKNMTVLELVALGRSPYTNWLGTLAKADKSKIESSVRQMELEALQNKKCHELSDGQLQRVMIARALAQDTSIILLDEPTTHLDLYHKVQILKLLKSVAHDTNKTIVFTTHEIEMAIQICDKMLLLNGSENPFGEPCELIEQKAFEKLFPSDTVSFDSTTASFRIQK